jgi:cytidylate kinase
MNETSPLVITISREIGSGGAYIGHKLSEDLDILYFDREIIVQVAERLNVYTSDVTPCDEKKQSFWRSIKHSFSELDTNQYGPPIANAPSFSEVYSAQSEVIRKLAKEKSAVIIGRGGFYILKDHPNLFSIFLHADKGFREKRIESSYHVNDRKAKKIVETIDHQRKAYIKKLTGQDVYNTRLYDLSIDTSKIGLDEAENLILELVKIRM